MKRAFCYEGGGVLGIAEAAALKVLRKHNIISPAAYHAGSSAGSIIAFAAATGISDQLLADFISAIDWRSFSPSTLAWAKLPFAWGLVKNTFRQIAEALMTAAGMPGITFGDVLNKFGSTLIITATKITDTAETIYFTPSSHPDMPVSLAISMSCSYPTVFEPVEWNGDLYVDGGLMDNYPVEFLCKQFSPSEVLGIRFESNFTGKKPRSFVEFSQAIIMGMHYKCDEETCDADILWLTTSVSSMDFNADLGKLYKTAEREAEKKLISLVSYKT